MRCTVLDKDYPRLAAYASKSSVDRCARNSGRSTACQSFKFRWFINDTLTTMSRRTQIWTVILAPFAFYLPVLVWNKVLVPPYQTVWYGDTVIQWRLDSDEPAMCMGAIKGAQFTSIRPTLLLQQ